MENKKQISHEGELHLGGMSIPCYILEYGTRVLSGNAMQNALKLQDESDNASGTRLARYLNQTTLKPFIYKDKAPGHFDPIVCYKGEQKIALPSIVWYLQSELIVGLKLGSEEYPLEV